MRWWRDRTAEVVAAVLICWLLDELIRMKEQSDA